MTADQPTSPAARAPTGITLRNSPGLISPLGRYSHVAVHAGVADLHYGAAVEVQAVAAVAAAR